MKSACFSQGCAQPRLHNVSLSLQRICTGLVHSFFSCMTGGKKSAKASAIALCSDPQTLSHAPMGPSFSISPLCFPSRFITRHLLDPEGEDLEKLVLRCYPCLHFRSLLRCCFQFCLWLEPLSQNFCEQGTTLKHCGCFHCCPEDSQVLAAFCCHIGLCSLFLLQSNMDPPQPKLGHHHPAPCCSNSGCLTGDADPRHTELLRAPCGPEPPGTETA